MNVKNKNTYDITLIFRNILFLHFIVLPGLCIGQNTYWKITDRQSIVWDLNESPPLPHSDNIEMAGKKIACIIHYSIDKGRNLRLERDIIFPQLRTFIKSNEAEHRVYRAYYRHIYSSEIQPNIFLQERILNFDKVDSVEIEGKLVFHHTPVLGLSLKRVLMPSMNDRLFVEKWELTNVSGSGQVFNIGNTKYQTSENGQKGKYNLSTYTDGKSEVSLSPGESYSFAIYFSAGIDDEQLEGYDFREVESQRDVFLTEMRDNLILKTPDKVLNTLFYFSKIRAAENIFESKMGIVHSPGGGNYYTGVWANDQVEYSGPFFPFLGYENGNIASFNAYKMFLDNIPLSNQPISSSFEMEGDLPCCGKDRGDAAMIAYGASQFALLLGDKEKALTLWPLIDWSLAYCKEKLNVHGVVMSTTDEMEGRISTGDANLATSSLYYGGLKFASYLAAELGYKSKSRDYMKRHNEMGIAIEKYFGTNLEGLDTYRYFDGNTHLRHWICLPLVMGINNRVEGTSTALLDKLWTDNGVLVEYNPESKATPVFWDRGTLYAFRGILKAGVFDKSMERLFAYSHKRLLEDHVPYVIEAYPENNMRHLSAESALYCRIFIEGLLGFEQTGFRSFEITPGIPLGFNKYSIEKMFHSNIELSFTVQKEEEKIRIKIYNRDSLIYDKKTNPGQKISVKF